MCRRSVGSRERVVENGILVDGRLHRIAWMGEDGGWRSGVSRMFLCSLFFPLFGMISSQTWEVFISLPVRKGNLVDSHSQFESLYDLTHVEYAR